MDRRWTVTSSRLLHQGRIDRLRLDTCRTPSGVEVPDYFVREVNDVALVFALTPSDEVVLVRQYRHGAGEESLELPQGLLEDGEDWLEAGRRELAEETGFEVQDLSRIGVLLASPAVQTNRVHVLLGTEARLARPPTPEPDEDLEVLTVALAQVEPLVHAGEIRAASSVAAALLALRRIGRSD